MGPIGSTAGGSTHCPLKNGEELPRCDPGTAGLFLPTKLGSFGG